MDAGEAIVKSRSEIKDSEKQDAKMIDASLEIVKLIDRLFKIGSYPLVAIGLGAIFTVSYIFALKAGFAAEGPASDYWLLVFGLAVILILGGFSAALVNGFSVHRKIHVAIRNYRATIEKAHDISLESINAVRALNEMLLLHVDTVAQVLDAAKPIIAAFEGESFVNSRYLSSDLVAFGNRTQNIIAEVEKAVAKADLKALQGYCSEIGQLARLTKQSIDRFRQSEWVSGHASRFTKSISSAREAALAYSDSATKMHSRIDAAIAPIIVTCKSVGGMPIVGTWLEKSGINEQVVSLQRLEILLGKAQAANLAVSAVVAAPGRDKLEAAVNCMSSLQRALTNEVIL